MVPTMHVCMPLLGHTGNSGDGGSVYLSAGKAQGASTISGGALQLLSGTGTARGGVVSLIAGTANTLNAVPVVLSGSACATGACVGGIVAVTGGSSVGATSTGGVVSISAGAGVATGGSIAIVSMKTVMHLSVLALSFVRSQAHDELNPAR